VFAANPQGKSARSVARVVQKRSNTTVFEVDLHTGRPHQIRIHLASIGHPLEGDPLYAPGGLPKTDHPGLPGDPGYWLHAQRITFTHPSSNKSMELTAPPPDILRIA
jgi:23S rRNA pseudouridine1911/1915/1917 synthase